MSKAAQAKELDKLVKVICSPRIPETLLPDLQRDLEEDAEVLITNRFRRRLTVGDEECLFEGRQNLQKPIQPALR